MPPLERPVKPPKTLRDEIADWCAKQPWIFYSPWPLYFAYVLLRYWHAIIETMLYPSAPTFYTCWFEGINLGMHELGHYVFAPFGNLLHVAGGSLFQCLVPLIGFVSFWRQGHFYALGVMGAWEATNLFYVATYMADSRARQLQLVAPGVGAVPSAEAGEMHDWWNLFSRFGLLRMDTTIAFLTRLAGTLLMLASIAWLAWLVWQMYRPVRPNPTTTIIKL